MLIVVPLLAAVFGLLYHQELRALAQHAGRRRSPKGRCARASSRPTWRLLVIAGIVAWWLVLAHKSRQVAQEESNRQTHLLMREIDSHRQTDEALQTARLLAEAAMRAAEQANQAKSRYISAISHELRTPLNSILGYAQLMGEDAGVPPHRKQAVRVIKRGGEHLLSLIEGTLDIARIEGGKLTLERQADALRRLRARDGAACSSCRRPARAWRSASRSRARLPEVVRADEKRVRQILINLLGNADQVHARRARSRSALRHAREMARIEIEDTGPGMAPEELEQIFEPFARGASGRQPRGARRRPGPHHRQDAHRPDGRRADGGEHARAWARCSACGCSCPKHAARAVAAPRRAAAARAVATKARAARILVVDNEEADRELLVQPAGAPGLRAAHRRQRPRRARPAGRRPRARRHPDGPGHARHRRLGDDPPPAPPGP